MGGTEAMSDTGLSEFGWTRTNANDRSRYSSESNARVCLEDAPHVMPKVALRTAISAFL